MVMEGAFKEAPHGRKRRPTPALNKQPPDGIKTGRVQKKKPKAKKKLLKVGSGTDGRGRGRGRGRAAACMLPNVIALEPEGMSRRKRAAVVEVSV